MNRQSRNNEDNMPAANIALAIWRGDEYILSYYAVVGMRRCVVHSIPTA